MKKYTNIYALVGVIMLFFTSCSTDRVEAPIDDTNSQYTTITFGALLNDLANRSMQKGHFAQVPTCSDAEPAVALIEFSYGGEDYSTTVAILKDGSGYFTDYSNDLKVPVPSDGSTMVTVTSFMVYDGNTSVASDAFYSAEFGNLIWIAPKGDDAQFDGYVEDALPAQFEVFPGTKPYFDIEVLCFDRRVVNEYGYVFFDIVPKTIYPLCLFVNYCNADARHWVADYSIDLYFGTNANGIQLYSNSNPNAMATTGMNGGEFSADPLCLVIPGPPANLGNDDPYLYLVIYPQDWTDSYGDIDNTPVPVQLSWNMVNALLNDDGTTNEYLHLLVGECEDALDGDGTIPGGGGGGGDTCATNPTGSTCDPDNDNLTNAEEAALGTDPNDADTDNDGVNDNLDQCALDGRAEGQVALAGQLGCWTDPVVGCNPTDCDLTTTAGGLCYNTSIDLADSSIIYKVTENKSFDLRGDKGALEPNVLFANANVMLDGSNLNVTLNTPQDFDKIKGYKVKIWPSDDSGNRIVDCFHALCDNGIEFPEGNQTAISLTFSTYEYKYPIYITVEAVVCEDIPGP